MIPSRHRPRQNSPLYLRSALELFLDSAATIWKSIWVFGLLYIIPFIFAFNAWASTPAIGSKNGQHWENWYTWFGAGFSTTGVPMFLWYAFAGFSFLWFLFVMVSAPIIQTMAQQAQLEAAEGKKLDLIKLFQTIKPKLWKMFQLYLVMALYISVGLLLFIIPGLIMIRRYFLAPYIMLENGGTIKESMEQSEHMTRGHSSAIWNIIGVMLVLGLINAFPYTGWMFAFAAGMFYSAAPALRYQELKGVHAPRRRPDNHKEPA
jgi:hypothetical protein